MEDDIDPNNEQGFRLQDWANRRLAQWGLGDTIAIIYVRWPVPHASLWNHQGRLMGTEPGVAAVAVPALVRRIERGLESLLGG
jgi:hypothetical protein